MTDTVDAATRSRIMARIGGKDTQPELLVRRQLHHRGLRFVLGGAGLPGRPDIVLPKWKAAVFVHGCFWHWHGCGMSRLPKSNRRYWRSKLLKNQARDTVAALTLMSAGWHVATVWECALRGAEARHMLNRSMDALAKWIRSPRSRRRHFEVPTTHAPPHTPAL